MGKVIDITDKLKFEESPRIKIKDIEVRLNDDATTMLKVMQKMGGKVQIPLAKQTKTRYIMYHLERLHVHPMLPRR